jgi:hypothetical protein
VGEEEVTGLTKLRVLGLGIVVPGEVGSRGFAKTGKAHLFEEGNRKVAGRA